MKIMQIIPSLARGGAERFVVDLSNELAKQKDVEVVLVSLFTNDSSTTFLAEVDKRIAYHNLGKKAGIDMLLFFKLARLVKKLNPAVIHVHLGAFEYIIPIMFSLPKINFFFTVHNEADRECPGPQILIKHIRKYLFRRKMIHPVVISPESARSFERFYGELFYTLIENGRPSLERTPAYDDLQRLYQFKDYDYLLLNVARINSAKNQQLLINAVNHINKGGQFKLKLLVIGGPQDAVLLENLKTMVIDNSIEFLGGRSNVADYLTISDFFCLSSEYEGMPISLIEALSLGCIPICTAVGGIKDMIVDGKTGFLCEVLDTGYYAETIQRALNAENKEIIRNNCIKSFNDRYHISITGKNYMNMFKQLDL